MNKLIKMSIAAALCGAALMSGCEREGNSSPSEIVVSGGESSSPEKPAFPASSCGVTLDKAVEKVVSLSPAATEIICELGFKSALVGISGYCDYPEGLSADKVGSTENPDLDKIIALKPDAVFTLSALSERDTYMLGQANIAVLTPSVPTSMEEYSALYREISAAFYGKELSGSEKGGTKAAEIGNRARAALEKAAEEVSLGSFVYVTEKLALAGTDTYENAVLGLSGTNLCTAGGYASASEISSDVPDYIIADSSLTYDRIISDETLSGFVSNGAKIRYVSAGFFERPTARTAVVFEEIKASEESGGE